ncbi:hypothetical protein SAMN05660690_1496 [Geodermatophilus telluris]|uniref:Uncharacterized protein n=1 Tax=Geodermatophilus telluris TaxID=1190417 RepID=A0A1G6LPT4_9ACTN|nr:hypothetical protein [Geodermatophilus telluris]SDC45282.1 hypothetical protein SAMN05660690_1496 [Geodermatophilus telluris]
MPTPLQPAHRLLRRQLLEHREELAAAAIEHLAHDLPGADVLARATHLVEELLRARFPVTWQQHYPDWIRSDAGRLHATDTPRPDACGICRAAARSSTAPPAAA